MAPTREQIEEALQSGSLSLGDFVGQTLVVSGFNVRTDGAFGPYAEISATTEEGEDVIVSNGGTAFNQLQKLEAIGAFEAGGTVSLLVLSFPTKFGKDGYKFEVI